MEGEGTRNRLSASLGRVSFRFGWCSGQFGRWRESPDPANVVGIFKKFAGIYKNPIDLHQKSPKSAWISSNLVGYHQIWLRSHLDLFECRRISPNLAWIFSNVAGSHQILLGSPRMSPDLTKSHLDVAGSHQISLGSPRILPDLYITSVGLGGSGFGEENPPLDPSTSGLGRGNLSPTVGVVGSGSFRFGFGRVAWVLGWLDTPSSKSLCCRVGLLFNCFP